MSQPKILIEQAVCLCGCGKPTALAKINSREKGWIKGQPLKYISGHQRFRKGVTHPYYPPKKRNPQYKINEATGCWEWQLVKLRGYGQMKYKGKMGAAHRFFYQRYKGPIPPDLEIDHLCQNRGCVNPDHLEAVSRKENNRRSPATKLNHSKVTQIRKMLQARISQYKIARIMGISQVTVSNIKTGWTWR